MVMSLSNKRGVHVDQVVVIAFIVMSFLEAARDIVAFYFLLRDVPFTVMLQKLNAIFKLTSLNDDWKIASILGRSQADFHHWELAFSFDWLTIKFVFLKEHKNRILHGWFLGYILCIHWWILEKHLTLTVLPKCTGTYVFVGISDL